MDEAQRLFDLWRLADVNWAEKFVPVTETRRFSQHKTFGQASAGMESHAEQQT